MQLTTFLLIISSAASVLAVDSSLPKFIKKDVVIIGGGGSGAYAAVRLKDKGLDVAVLEQKDQLGGHMETYTDPDTGIPYNTGVIFFHDIPVVRNYFSRFGVELAKAAIDSSGTTYLNFATGNSVPGFEETPPAALGAALQAYAPIIAKYPYLGPSLQELPDPVPEELLVPFEDFVEQNGLEDLVQLLSSIEQNNGYLLKRPAIFVLHCFSQMLFDATLNGFINAASGNNRDIYKGVGEYLGDDIFFHASVKNIDRRRGITVLASTERGKVLIHAKKLLIAIPPLLSNLRGLGLDLTRAEAATFSRWKSFWYSSSVFHHEGLNGSVSISNIGTEPPFYMATQPGSFAFSGIEGTDKVVSWFGSEDPNLTEKEVKGHIRAELKRLADEGHIGPGTPDFKFYSGHSPYRMQTTIESIKNGFYKDLFALQGQSDTFYTGAAWTDNDSSLIWTWTESYLLPRLLSAVKNLS